MGKVEKTIIWFWRAWITRVYSGSEAVDSQLSATHKCCLIETVSWKRTTLSAESINMVLFTTSLVARPVKYILLNDLWNKNSKQNRLLDGVY